jgi:GT2 family glycosyltransferase
MRPQFSILIVTDSCPETAAPVAACLTSLRMTRTRDDVECLVLANGSAPEVLRFLRAEPGITRLIVWAQDRGLAAGRAALLKLARGRLLVFLDVKTVVEDSLWLDRLAAALKSQSVGLAGPGGRFIRHSWRATFSAPPGSCDILEGGCLAFRRELRQELDLTGSSGDAELCLQVRRAGWEVSSSGPIGLRCEEQAGDYEGLRRRWQGKGLIMAECGYGSDPHPLPPLPLRERGESGSPPPAQWEKGTGDEGLVEEVQAWHAQAWQI